ncbi:hypothetical protein VOM14_20045 [Paraburkholderia sp. MPAMCS5]|uniref:hypothetical protein n=1 Tax=Paraburkholderia sp. MPAMCS5 TaxID=3112563 RepID=UPI002E188B45|nr:hypothetical protein [Paraburkholderia sp. MPAMCS5]
MRNLSKTFVFFLLATSSCEVWSGQAFSFDKPGLVSFEDHGAISGYYNVSDGERSCTFLFVSAGGEINDPSKSPYSEVKLLTFVPRENSFSFSERDKSYDISGTLYRRDGTWIVRTDEGQAGCENSLGSFMSSRSDKVGGEIFSVRRTISATGIRLIGRKTYLFDLKRGRYVAKKAYLTKWDGVIVLQTHEPFTLVRFADAKSNVANPGKVTTGWVRSADLVDPFPPTAKHQGEAQ